MFMLKLVDVKFVFIIFYLIDKSNGLNITQRIITSGHYPIEFRAEHSPSYDYIYLPGNLFNRKQKDRQMI